MKDLLVIYLTHNRLYYTGITLPQVINECKKSERFKELIIYDDDSTDGTKEFLQTIKSDLPISIVNGKWGNTVSQINHAKNKHSKDCRYLYILGNDIIIPNNLFDTMCGFMDNHIECISAMVQETSDLPVCNGIESVFENFEYSTFTSSLGIHRLEYMKGDITAEKRFFGFQPYQQHLMRTKGYKAVRIKNISNTNLDMSCWSKQIEFKEKGYSRMGLVSNKKSLFIW